MGNDHTPIEVLWEAETLNTLLLSRWFPRNLKRRATPKGAIPVPLAPCNPQKIKPLTPPAQVHPTASSGSSPPPFVNGLDPALPPGSTPSRPLAAHFGKRHRFRLFLRSY